MTRRFQLDPSSMSRRDLILIFVSAIVIIGVIVGLVILFTQRQPSKRVTVTPIPTRLPSPSAVSASSSPSQPPVEAATAGPTPTLEPYRYTIQKGDTLGFIVQICCGYRDTSIYPEVVRLNNLPNENVLPPPGSVLLIPRQTPTEGPSSTPTLEGTPPGPTQDYHGCGPKNRCVSADGGFWLHEIVSGDTIFSVAYAYNTQPDAVLRANGLTQSSLLVVGQRLLIPILVTLTPTLTPTGGPDSTATPTPTLSAPSLLAPFNGSSAPRAQTVVLQWVTNHPLEADQSYLIILRDTDSGKDSRYTTRSNSYRLPADAQPGIGQSIHYEWQVVVIAGSDSSSPPISGQDAAWTFTWGP